MKSVKTQVQPKQAEVMPEAVQTVQAPKMDSMNIEEPVASDTLPTDSLQDTVVRPAFRKSMRVATHDLGISKKMTVAALGEGDSVGMRHFRARLRQIFGDDPVPEMSKDLEHLKKLVENEFREVKTGKTESDVGKRDIDLLLRTVNSVLSAGAVVDEALEEDSVDDAELELGGLEEEDAEEVAEDLSDVDTMDISEQDAEALLRADVTEVEVVQEVLEWREFRQEEEYEIMSVRKNKEEEEEDF